MIARRFSVFSRIGLLVLALAGLAACDEIEQDLAPPKIFGIEVPDEVLNAPRPVPKPVRDADDGQWPLVGAVPPRPKNFMSQQDIDALRRDMQEDRSSGSDLQKKYQDAPPVTPVGPLAPAAPAAP